MEATNTLYYIRYSDLNRIDIVLYFGHASSGSICSMQCWIVFYLRMCVRSCVYPIYKCQNRQLSSAARALISSKIINQNNYKKKVSRLTPVHAKCTAQSPNPSFSHSPKATSSSSISWIQRRTLIIFLLGRSSCLIHTSILCNFYQNTSHEESSSHVLESFRPIW